MQSTSQFQFLPNSEYGHVTGVWVRGKVGLATHSKLYRAKKGYSRKYSVFKLERGGVGGEVF
jgi:hypothetical protein